MFLAMLLFGFCISSVFTANTEYLEAKGPYYVTFTSGKDSKTMFSSVWRPESGYSFSTTSHLRRQGQQLPVFFYTNSSAEIPLFLYAMRILNLDGWTPFIMPSGFKNLATRVHTIMRLSGGLSSKLEIHYYAFQLAPVINSQAKYLETLSASDIKANSHAVNLLLFFFLSLVNVDSCQLSELSRLSKHMLTIFEFIVIPPELDVVMNLLICRFRPYFDGQLNYVAASKIDFELDTAVLQLVYRNAFGASENRPFFRTIYEIITAAPRLRASCAVSRLYLLCLDNKFSYLNSTFPTGIKNEKGKYIFGPFFQIHDIFSSKTLSFNHRVMCECSLGTCNKLIDKLTTMLREKTNWDEHDFDIKRSVRVFLKLFRNFFNAQYKLIKADILQVGGEGHSRNVEVVDKNLADGEACAQKIEELIKYLEKVSNPNQPNANNHTHWIEKCINGKIMLENSVNSISNIPLSRKRTHSGSSVQAKTPPLHTTVIQSDTNLPNTTDYKRMKQPQPSTSLSLFVESLVVNDEFWVDDLILQNREKFLMIEYCLRLIKATSESMDAIENILRQFPTALFAKDQSWQEVAPIFDKLSSIEKCNFLSSYYCYLFMRG